MADTVATGVGGSMGMLVQPAEITSPAVLRIGSSVVFDGEWGCYVLRPGGQGTMSIAAAG